MKIPRFVRDAAERAGWTFIQGALGSVALEQLATGDTSALRAAAIGGIAAVLSLLKSVAARKVGDPESASTTREV